MSQPMNTKTGWIEVICGPMFSGKTEDLIRRIHLAHQVLMSVQVFKPVIDKRYSETAIVTHGGERVEATPVRDVAELEMSIDQNTVVVAIDEAQFFGLQLVSLAQRLADRGVVVIIAGLDQDYLGVGFEPMPELLAIAEKITKHTAICAVCWFPATRTHRKGNTADRIKVGGSDDYEPRCRLCTTVSMKSYPPFRDSRFSITQRFNSEFDPDRVVRSFAPEAFKRDPK